jgi:predicted amino acid dehydrogenase
VTTEEPKLVQEIRDKIQDAVTIARELGDDNVPIGMVGLGAYTSIVTQNGLTLNDYEVSITTGNAYTVALTLLGIQRGAEIKQIELSTATAAIIGASGNIGLVIAQFLVCGVDRLMLIGRGRESLRKLSVVRNACLEVIMQEVRTQILVGNKDEGTRCGGIFKRFTNVIKPRWKMLENSANALGNFVRYGTWNQETASLLCQFLHECGHSEDTIDSIELSNEIAGLEKANLVIVATNSPDSELLQPDMLKPGSVLCCTSVPSNLGSRFTTEQHDILAFDGGLATLPPSNLLDFVGMPGGTLVYGCLAETLVLGFEGSDNSFCKGIVTKSQVERILAAAHSHGFSLGSFKLGDRIFCDDEVIASVEVTVNDTSNNHLAAV